MLERSPEYEKIVPIFAVVSLRNDMAIAQTIQPPQPQIPPPDVGQSVLFGGGLMIGGAALWSAIAKMLEKYGTNFIDGQKSRLNLEIEAKKLELELNKEERLAEREESKGKDKIIESTINLALSNLAQGARDSHEANYLLAGKLEAANQLTQKEFAIINDHLSTQEKRIESIDNTLKQILNVLKMRDRSGE